MLDYRASSRSTGRTGDTSSPYLSSITRTTLWPLGTDRSIFGHYGNGYETAKSRHLFRDLVDATAQVTITEKGIAVRFQKRVHNPLLLAAGFDKTNLPIPWLDDKPLSVWSSDNRSLFVRLGNARGDPG
jgi:hypothetical protein